MAHKVGSLFATISHLLMLFSLTTCAKSREKGDVKSVASLSKIAFMSMIPENGIRRPTFSIWNQEEEVFGPIGIEDPIIDSSTREFVKLKLGFGFEKVKSTDAVNAIGVQKILDSLRFKQGDELTFHDEPIPYSNRLSIVTISISLQREVQGVPVFRSTHAIKLLRDFRVNKLKLIPFALSDSSNRYDNWCVDKNQHFLYCSKNRNTILTIDVSSLETMHSIPNYYLPIIPSNGDQLLAYDEKLNRIAILKPIEESFVIEAPRIQRVYSCFQIGDRRFLLGVRLSSNFDSYYYDGMDVLLLDFALKSCVKLIDIPSLGDIIGAS